MVIISLQKIITSCTFTYLFSVESLLMVAVLGVIVLFIYAVASFAFLHKYFIETLYCDTLAECMYSVLRYGLLDNIGLVNER